MATASYCNKEYCGKEWAAFQYRIDRYSIDANLGSPAPLVIPVLWVKPSERLAPFPDAIKKCQYYVGDPASKKNALGVKNLTKLKGVFKKEYVGLITELATRIVSLAADHQRIDSNAEVPELAGIKSLFSSDAALAADTDAREMKQCRGPKHVYFVYGAVAPEELRDAGRRSMEAYGESGGSEWQPFFPKEQTVGAVAPQIAGSDDIGMIPHEMPLSADLDAQVRRCETNKQLVILLLDAWTLMLAKYRELLRKFDEQNYSNCSILMPWNEADTETTNSGVQLWTLVRKTLFHRSKSGGNLFFRNDIRGLEQLREELADVLVRLRAEVINRTHPDAEALPTRSGARPTITGPGGTQ
jgi:FxsC-like protein